MSETSSGYISTSVSTATLSDVYTLSWDLPPPPPSSRRIDGFEATPDAEEESLAAEPQPPQAREALLAWDDPALSGPDGAPPDPAAQLRTREGPPHKPASKAEEESLAQEDERAHTEPRQSAQTPELGPRAADGTEDPPSLRSGAPGAAPRADPGPDRASSGRIPEAPRVPVPTPAPSVETEAAPEVPTSSSVPNHDAPTAPGPARSDVQPPKLNPSGTNPFKIQKVKSSDLRSFQPVLGMDEQADGAGGLAAPLESLEIISDSEGDSASAAVLPDWLKEGEFVTVGGNKSGTVRYVGPADFAEGTWVGVELEVPAGE